MYHIAGVGLWLDRLEQFHHFRKIRPQPQGRKKLVPCFTIFPLVLKFESSSVVFLRILAERIFQSLLLGHQYRQSRFIGLQGLVGLIIPFIF